MNFIFSPQSHPAVTASHGTPKDDEVPQSVNSFFMSTACNFDAADAASVQPKPPYHRREPWHAERR
jgi:hypothetical protein